MKGLAPGLAPHIGLLGVLAAWLPLVVAHAEPAPGAILPMVEISASALPPGLGVDLAHLPYTVRRAGAGQRADGGDEELSAYMARRFAGVNLNEISGNGLQNDLTFRGFRLSPTLGSAQGLSVYLDGVRANEPFGDVMNWDLLPQAALGEVMLVAGANPLFGLNTLGGTLALSTKSGLSDPGWYADWSHGASGRRRLDLRYGLNHPSGLHALFAASAQREDGWREHAGGKLGNVFGKLGGRFGAGQWELSLLHGSSALQGNGLLPGMRWDDGELRPGLYQSRRAAAYTFPDITRNRLTQLSGQWRHALAERVELSASAYLRRGRRGGVNGDIHEEYGDYVEDCADGFDAAGAPLDDDCHLDRAQGAALPAAALNTSLTRQRSAGASVKFSIDLARHALLFGATYDSNQVTYHEGRQDGAFSAQRGVIAAPGTVPQPSVGLDGHASALGAYASDTWQAGRATWITGSLRLNHVAVTNTLVGKKRERFVYNKLNPALGIVHELKARQALSLFLNAAQSNRVPTVIELGCADPEQPCRLPVGLQADPYLHQVVSHLVEGGVRARAGAHAEMSLTAYRSINRDDILFFSASASQRGYFANYDRTRREGLELAASGALGDWSGAFSLSMLKAVYDAPGVLFAGERNVQVERGTPIAGMPRRSAKLALSWRASPAWRIGADLVASSSLVSQGNEDGLLADPEPGEAPLAGRWRVPGNTRLNLQASYRFSPAWQLYAGVDNVFNRGYASYGMLASDLFPNGRLVRPHAAEGSAASALFVAPGAPRSWRIGVRGQL